MSSADISFNNGDLLIFSDVSVNGVFSASGTTPDSGTGSGKDNSGITGEIRLWSTNTPPASWLLCDGSSYSIITYQNLYNVISTNYGGDETTFKVPDFRRRIPIGNDSTNNTYGNNIMNSTDGRSASNMNLTQGPSYYNDNNVGKQNIYLNTIITHKHNIQSHTHDMTHNHNVNADFLNHTHDISHNHVFNQTLALQHNHPNITPHKHDETSINYQGPAEHSHQISDHNHEVNFDGNNHGVAQFITEQGHNEYNTLREGAPQRNVFAKTINQNTEAALKDAFRDSLDDMQLQLQQQNTMGGIASTQFNVVQNNSGNAATVLNLSDNNTTLITGSNSIITDQMITSNISGATNSKTTAETPVTESNLGVAIPNNPHFIVLNYIIKT